MAGSEKCFIFEWKLENVSYCVQEKNAYILSPTFVVNSIDDGNWYLGIYLRGTEDENYISFNLYRNENNKGAVQVEIYYELAFIEECGSVLKSSKKIKGNFRKNQGRGFPAFIERQDIFHSRKSEFLPHDTLTARCTIWKSDGEMKEIIKCFGRTRLGIQKRSFVWKVENFSSLELEKKCSYQLKSIENDAPLLSVDLFLTAGLSYDEIIRFELSLQDVTKRFSTLKLFLIDASGNIVECNQVDFKFGNLSKSMEFTFFFTKNRLMAMKDSYLPDDVLSLQWEWAFYMGVISNKIEDVQYACICSDYKSSNAQNLNSQKDIYGPIPVPYFLNDNLKSLRDENFLCDVKLNTNTKLFQAHKIILSASSSVFKAMFSSDMKEKDSNCVNIEDLSDDTISRMLAYIYTARTDDLTCESASYLYIAADKYAILSLKDICSSYLKDNLSPSTACEVLLLAELHFDFDLKSAVQDYILKNVKDVIKSSAWKLLMDTNPKLAAETLCLQHE